MKDKILAALRAAIETIEAGELAGIRFVTLYAEGEDFHDTADDAESEAEAELDARRDESTDDTGWHEGTGNIGWGIYVPVQVVDAIDRGPDPSRPQFDTILDYDLRDWDGDEATYCRVLGRLTGGEP